MYLVPIFAVLFKSLYELLVLFLGPPPILLGLIKGFLILAARLI
jgi:hypothetical protein